MINSSPLVATAAATAAVASAATSSLSPSLPPYTKNLPLCRHRFSLLTPFPFLVRSKPIKHPKLNTHFSVIHAVTRPSVFNEDAQFVEPDHEEREEEDDEVEEDEEEEKDEGLGSQSDGSGRLYVGNLPYDLTTHALSEIFSEAGDVKNVEIIYNKVTRRSRGFAFITMGSVEEANKAIGMFNESLVGGRKARVNFPEVPKGGEREVMMASRPRDTHKLYATNLPWSLTSQGLKQAFAGQPGFLHAKVVYDRDSGKPLGYGFVSFASAQEMEAALNAMNGVEVQGRPLRLEFVKERRPTLSESAVETDG